MTKRLLNSLLGLIGLAAAGYLFLGFIIIAGQYDWSFTAEIDFGNAAGSEIIGPVWIPLAMCLFTGLLMLWMGAHFAKKAIDGFRKTPEQIETPSELPD